MLRHRRMLLRARDSGFPMPLARDLGPAAVRPNRGVAPGCSWATTMVKTSTQGSQDRVAERLIAAAIDLREAVHQDIKAELATAKAATVATSDRLAKRIRRALGVDGGCDVDSTAALGIDFSCGRQRGRVKMRSLSKRLRTVASRKRRLAIISKAARGRVGKLVRCGIAPTALYGAAVTGL
eukprot:9121577-Karenia_brevis.AAC.1